jgi:ABC-type multidrug transport system fused ATPase/permease subunit
MSVGKTCGQEPVTITGLLFEFIKNHKYMLVIYLCFLFIMPIKDIGIPHLFGKLIKSIEDKTSLIVPLIYLCVITIIMHVGYSIIDLLEVDLSPLFQAFIRQKVIKHIIDESDNNLNELESGKIISKLMRLPVGLYGFLNQWKYIFIPNVLLSIVAVAYFTYYNVTLGVLLLLLITFSWIMIIISVKTCLKYSYPSEVAVMYMYEQVDDVLKNMMTVLSSNQQDQEIENLQKFEVEYKDYVKKTLLCSLKMRYMVVPFNILYFAFFIYIGYTHVKQGKMRASVFIALVIVMFKVFNSVWDISGVMNDAATRWGILKQSMEIFNYENCPIDNPDGRVHSNVKNGFYMKDITFKYPNTEKPILNNFYLHIPKETTIVILGGIGSGKSTVMKLLLKQLTPTNGTIYYQGIPYDMLNTEDIRKNIGYIQQHAVLFNRSILENIRYGLDPKFITERKINELVDTLDLREMFNKFADGLETNVGKYGSKLSGGQKQIIILLRVLLQNPPILLMDEPTASIDESTKLYIYKIIEKVIASKTVVMVTHDKYLLKFANRVITMESGEIIKDESEKK